MGDPERESGIPFIVSVLQGVKARLHRAHALEASGSALALALGLCAALAALDNLFWLPGGARVLAAAAAAALFLAFACMAAFRVFRRISDDSAALFVESVLPGLENRIINSLQISRQTLTGWSHHFAVLAAAESAAVLAQRGEPPVGMRRAGRAWAASGAAILFLALYAVLAGDLLANAALRYARPFGNVSPVSDLRILVEPGDAEVFKGSDFRIRAGFEGPVPDSLKAEISAPSGTHEAQMDFADGAFILDLTEVSEGFSYRCFRGQVTSPVFRVGLKTRPEARRIDLKLEYPAYTRRQPRVQENCGGDVLAVAGTKVEATAFSDKPLARAEAVFGDGSRIEAKVSGASLTFAFDVARNDTYTISLTDTEGIASSAAAVHSVRSLPDMPPAARITSPGRDSTVEKVGRIPVNFQASDDIGLESVSLRSRVEPAGEERILKTWEIGGGETAFSDSFLLDPEDLGLDPGEVLTYQIVARDGLGQTGPSPIYIVKIVSPEDAQKKLESEVANLLAKLRAILRAQRLATQRTALAVKAAPDKPRARKLLQTVEKEQAGVLTASRDAARSVRGSSPFESSARAALLDLAANEMPAAVSEASVAAKTVESDGHASSVKALAGLQKAIENRLEALIRGVEDFVEKMKNGEASLALSDRRRLLDRTETLRNLKDSLAKFVDEQKKIIRESKELAAKPADDFTEADDKKAADLAQAEDKLANILRDLMDDLSRLPEQDMSDATVSEELVEIYVEVEKAADALTRKTIELAVPFEQSGVELAEQLTKNLEKWLPDVRDNIKWNMEDPTEDMEVPLVDLPEELEDMVGDLIESQNDLEEDVEDVSSKWADSLDKGAGWSTMDGPISNMSAQGKTGNYLPNNNEVGGRSGEGRTGRSHGQMVENTATGKGGRQTPFRKTPDPYEAGKVDDKSNDPGGGATGGGKLSGSGADGQRGQTPPPLEKELARLSGRQVEIRETAEKLERDLKVRRYPAGGVENAVLLMKKAEECLKAGRIADFAALKKDILIRLGEADAAVKDELQVNREAVKAMPKGLREDLMNVGKEAMPEKYRERLMAYFRTLSRGGK